MALIGFAILTIGTLGLARLTLDTTRRYIIILYFIRMLGISMIMMTLTTSGLNTLDRGLYAHGNAANNTLRQVAGSIGTSIIITIMSKASQASNISDPMKATVFGMNVSFIATGALTFMGLIIAFFVIKKKENIV